MGLLKVPGAQLYYETYGSGPLLLMIHGAGGSSNVFNAIVKHLAPRYTVVIYDRRGYSNSKLDGVQNETSWLQIDAEDVRHLIEHLSDKPAIVFGNSSGAIVALEALARHPSVVRTLVPHEPPLTMLLPDAQKWADLFSEIYNLYRKSGVKPALLKFFEAVLPNSDPQSMFRTPRNETELANSVHWFEHELRQYPSTNLNLDELGAYANRIFLVAGRESHGQLAYETSAALARRLGWNMIELAGGHIGFRTQPDEFARQLENVLSLSGQS